MKVSEYLNPRLEPGTYLLECADIRDDRETTAGDPMISIKWVNRGGGESIWDNIPVQPNAAWKMAQLWVAINGTDNDEVGELDEFAAKLQEALAGAEVYASTDIQSYKNRDGQDREKASIVAYLAPEAGKAMMEGGGPIDKESPF